MGIQQFQTVAAVWYVLFFVIVTFCIICTVLAAKRNNGKFVLPYILELVLCVVNLLFMYIIDKDYIDYGNDKFSGLSAMGDWLGFGILILITMIPVAVTVICNIRYIIKKKQSTK